MSPLGSSVSAWSRNSTATRRGPQDSSVNVTSFGSPRPAVLGIYNHKDVN